jgi:hypothetical protein
VAGKDTNSKWLIVPLVVVLSPFIISVLCLWFLYSVTLSLLVWVCWLTRGRDVLFVYSDSPHWREYVEAEILPRIKNRAVVLNWSERRKWLRRWSLAPMLFRNFGGYREFNPIGFHFRFLHAPRAYRFWEPLMKWRKKDDAKDLDALLERFYSDLGIQMGMSSRAEALGKSIS